jgi:cephalosporin hydroxylase
MDPIKEFERQVETNIEGLGKDYDLKALTNDFIVKSAAHKYSYNFSWLGRPAIQFPTDAWAMQEIIWRVKPDLIIETGIAHGGSIIYYASLMAQLDLCEAIQSKSVLNPLKSNRRVLGIDIEIRDHNRVAIESHPMSNYIQMIEGSSIDPDIISQVKEISKKHSKVMVIFDSNHTHDHVLKELNSYAMLTSIESYCVVFDTLVEDMPVDMFHDRPWGVGNNPKTAVWDFLKSHENFQIDKDIQNKLLITVAPDGFLKRIS